VPKGASSEFGEVADAPSAAAGADDDRDGRQALSINELTIA
jgi:hypothetical protein